MTSQAVAATLVTMGLASPNSTAHITSPVPLYSTENKLMGKTRRVRTKGWCGLHDGIPGRIPSIWKELKLKTTRNDRIDRLIRVFSPDETGDDSVDITVSDRLGTCIVTGKYGAGLGFSYKNCHHGLTIFATASQAADEVAIQLLDDDVQREAAYKSVTDIRDSKGKPPPLVEDYYTLMVWLKK